MIRNCIVRDYLEYAKANRFEETVRQSLKEQMRTNAIHDNGIRKTFCFSENCFDFILDYIKIEDKDIELYPDMFEKRSYFKLIYPCDNPTDQSLYNPCSILEFQDILNSCLLYNETNEIDDTLKLEFEEIKKECVEKYNAVYSSVNIDDIEINKEYEIIIIYYSYHYIKDEFINKIDPYEAIFGEGPLPYDEWFNSDSQSTDESEKDNIVLTKDVKRALKNKVKVNIDHSCPVFPEINTNNGSEYEEKTSRTCNTCRDKHIYNGSQYCTSCNDYPRRRSKLHTQENLMETLMFLRVKNAHLEYELEQCKEDKQVFPGYCMDCKNIGYVTHYDNNTKKAHTIDYCKHWSKEDSDGNTIYAETVADGYCYMFKPFEPKDDDKDDDTTGTWSHGICDNCGYDWSKDAPTASVPEYCPNCGQKKKLNG